MVTQGQIRLYDLKNGIVELYEARYKKIWLGYVKLNEVRLGLMISEFGPRGIIAKEIGKVWLG